MRGASSFEGSRSFLVVKPLLLSFEQREWFCFCTQAMGGGRFQDTGFMQNLREIGPSPYAIDITRAQQERGKRKHHIEHGTTPKNIADETAFNRRRYDQ